MKSQLVVSDFEYIFSQHRSGRLSSWWKPNGERLDFSSCLKAKVIIIQVSRYTTFSNLIVLHTRFHNCIYFWCFQGSYLAACVHYSTLFGVPCSSESYVPRGISVKRAKFLQSQANKLRDNLFWDKEDVWAWKWEFGNDVLCHGSEGPCQGCGGME